LHREFHFGTIGAVRWRDVGKLDCTIARTLSVIGDRWTLLVLRDAFLGTRRFDAFQASLGITRHRLADRLRKLVRHGVLRRERYQVAPPRFEYRLTEKGIDLYGVIVTIAGWGDKYMASKDGPPLERVHRACGHATQLRLTCDHCGDVVSARDMTARPTRRYRGATRPSGGRRMKERA
jgi:DNA-binding HxlR family transcriptional regulator